MRGSERSAVVFDFRAELKRQRRHRWGRALSAVLFGLAICGMLGFLAISWPAVSTTFGAFTRSQQFAVCGMDRRTCVIDGDTFWLDGERIRIADIDTPEISEPRFATEYARGIDARDRLVVLLNEGPFNLTPIGNRDRDQYGRRLRVAVRNGQSIGDRLVSEGLARTWTGRREPWC